MHKLFKAKQNSKASKQCQAVQDIPPVKLYNVYPVSLEAVFSLPESRKPIYAIVTHEKRFPPKTYLIWYCIS